MHKLSLLMLAATATASEFHDIVKQVNLANAGWKAEVPARFNSTEEVKRLCGTYLPGHPQYKTESLRQSEVQPLLGLPASFDVRTAFPKCSVIGHVRDQSACGSCWAFSATETFEGRRCAQKGENIDFSEEDTTSCCNYEEGCFSNGCGGGQPAGALQWISTRGVVTGGDYKETGTCLPYSLPPCAHHVKSEKYKPCPAQEYSTPQCTKQCQSGFSKSYSQDKVAEGSVTSLSGVNQIKTALQKGPLSTAFTVYADFPAYKSGVYKHTHGSALGGHAVLIVGYGTEDGTDYWLVKNSWNEDWGDHGFFKIAFGQCGIDDSPTAIDF